jgi:hypothetical protein
MSNCDAVFYRKKNLTNWFYLKKLLPGENKILLPANGGEKV